HFPLHELPPAENGIGTQRIEPGDQPDVAALLPLPQRAPECPARFGRVAALLNCLRNVRLHFLINLSAYAIGAKYIGNTRPQGHIRPSLRIRLTPEIQACSDVRVYRRRSKQDGSKKNRA